MKITIIGNCGSGKSTLAKRIGEKLNIPHIHLDRFWFEANGHITNKESEEEKEKVRVYIKNKVEELIKLDSWVSDGWYLRIQPLISEKADHVVFLDIPLWRRLANHFYRIFFSERHPELSRLDDLKFTFEIIRRQFSHDPQMRKFIQKYPEKTIHLKSYKEVEEYFGGLK